MRGIGGKCQRGSTPVRNSRRCRTDHSPRCTRQAIGERPGLRSRYLVKPATTHMLGYGTGHRCRGVAWPSMEHPENPIPNQRAIWPGMRLELWLAVGEERYRWYIVYLPDCDLNIEPLVPWPCKHSILTMMAASWVSNLGLGKNRETKRMQAQRKFPRVRTPCLTCSYNMFSHETASIQVVSSVGVRGRSPWSVLRSPELIAI